MRAKAKPDAMESEHAGNAKALSDAKEDLGLTRKQRLADIELLRGLRHTCQNLDREWEARSKTRLKKSWQCRQLSSMTNSSQIIV